MTAPTQFQDPTPDDFAEPVEAPRPAGTNPVTGQPFTTKEVVREMLGAPSKASEIEPNPVNRFLAGAGQALTNKYQGLTGGEPAPDFGLSEDLAGSFGQAAPDAVVSMAAPARVVPQMVYGAATRAIEPGDPLERAANAAKGAAEFGTGQALASGVVRGVNAATGNLTREGQAAAAARTAGLDLSAGDLTNSKLLQLAEENSFASPTKGQAGQVAAIMTTKGGDPITLSIKSAYDAAQGKVAAAASELDALIATGKLPNVTPRETYRMVHEIARRSPDTLKNVRDPELQQMLMDIANYPKGRIPKGASFSSLDELRKVLGPVMAKVDMQSKSGASNVTTADANRWKQLYKGIMTDIEGWGSKAATEDALKAHKTLSTTFKNEVLPLREHPIAGKVLDGDYARPEDLLRDISSVRNKSIVNDLYARLDTGGQNAFDALRMAGRGNREFRLGEERRFPWAKPLALTGAATLPFVPGAMTAVPWFAAALGGEQALVHGLNTRLGKTVLSGSPRAAQSPLGNAATYSALRTAAQQGGLEALRPESRQR